MRTELEQKVIDYYITDKLSGQKIATILHVNVKTVFAILKRNNIKSRTLSESTMKYTCQDNFFNVINTEKKAYWLGVLFADGNITKKASKSGQIIFSSKDKEWVELFLSNIGSNNFPNCEYQKVFKKYIWKAQITSAQMYNDLNNLGCTPAKTKTIKVPIINDDLIHHFIRGYFDGDGSVFISKEKHWRNNNVFPVIHFRFIGTKAFLNVLDEKINLSGRLVQAKDSKVYELSYKRNKKANLFYNYLYKDATIFLERKKEIFKAHLQEKGSETIIS
jgi:hypothetical protein